MDKAKVKQRIETVGLYSLIGSCFFIPFSSSLMGATTALALLCWILSGKVIEFPRLIFSNVLVFIATALFCLLIAGVFYSPAEPGDALSVLKKYRELLLFGMAVSYFRGREEKAVYGEWCYIGGSILLLTISYAMYFGFIPTEKYGYSTVYHITHSFFMALLAFWALQRIIDGPVQRFFWALVFIATLINLFYIAPGRTGMLVFVGLLLVSVFQRLSFKKAMLGLLVCVAVVGVAYFTSSNFSSRVTEAVHEVQHYQPGQSRTSLGMRFDWWHNSITLIKEKPLLGHGTGSFEVVQKQLIEGTKTKGSDNPHNEYLLIAVQVGLVGCLLYVTLLGGIFVTGIQTSKPGGFMLQGIAVSMFLGCLMNSFLFDSHQGHFFAIISAVMLAISVSKKAQEAGNVN